MPFFHPAVARAGSPGAAVAERARQALCPDGVPGLVPVPCWPPVTSPLAPPRALGRMSPVETEIGLSSRVLTALPFKAEATSLEADT